MESPQTPEIYAQCLEIVNSFLIDYPDAEQIVKDKESFQNDLMTAMETEEHEVVKVGLKLVKRCLLLSIVGEGDILLSVWTAYVIVEWRYGDA